MKSKKTSTSKKTNKLQHKSNKKTTNNNVKKTSKLKKKTNKTTIKSKTTYGDDVQNLLNDFISPTENKIKNEQNNSLCKKSNAQDVFDNLDYDNFDSTQEIHINNEIYQLTPKGILYSLLKKYYDISNNLDTFEKFSSELMHQYSSLASGNTSDEMFGDDINTFFVLLVRTLNVSGKLKQILDEHGINVNINDLLDDNENDN